MKKAIFVVLVIIAGLLAYIAFKPQTPAVYPDQIQQVSNTESQQNTNSNQNQSQYIVPSSKKTVLEKILTKYSHPVVSVSECSLNNQTHFAVRIEQTGDAGTDYYTSSGTMVANCGAFLPIGVSEATICQDLRHGPSCVDIYRPSGQTMPAVNTYNIKTSW